LNTRAVEGTAHNAVYSTTLLKGKRLRRENRRNNRQLITSGREGGGSKKTLKENTHRLGKRKGCSCPYSREKKAKGGRELGGRGVKGIKTIEEGRLFSVEDCQYNSGVSNKRVGEEGGEQMGA